MINHSPYRAVSPGPYLFQVRVFLLDFPHRAVNFLTGEMCPSLHDEEEQAKLQKKLLPPPVCLSLAQKVKQNTHCSSTSYYALHPTSVNSFQNNFQPSVRGSDARIKTGS